MSLHETSIACLACGSNTSTLWAAARDVEYRTSSESFNYRRCEACAALFIDPVPETRLSEIYPPNYYSYAIPGRSLVYAIKQWLDRRFFRSLLAALPGERLRVLDVGGGAGWELSSLRNTDSRVQETLVVDFDPGAAEIARKNGHRYFCGRIEDYQTADRFDLVLLLNLIEHVRHPAQVLRKIHSLLSPDGAVLIKTPNYRSWDAALFRHLSWAGYHCPRHWVIFTEESFTRLVLKCGLAIRSATYTQGSSFWSASILAWLAARHIVRITKERPVFDHPLFAPIAAVFAAVDFLRRPFARTSQMFFVLEKVRGNGSNS